MIKTTLLNGITTERDKDYTALGLTILEAGVVSGLEVTTNQVGTGTAFIKVTRTATTPTEEILVKLEITANEVIDTSGTKKVWLEINQNNINDPGLNDVNGTTAGSIKTGASYPASNYIPLASITGGVITDDRVFVRLKLLRKWLTPNRIFYTDSTGQEIELAFGTAGQILTGNGLTNPPSWQLPATGDIPAVIKPYAGATAPDGYFICDGQAVSRTTYSVLFWIIWTTYGVGDGSTTFNIPNLKGRAIVWFNTAETEFNAVGKTWGAKTHTLTTAEMPAHTHNLTFATSGGSWQPYLSWTWSNSAFSYTTSSQWSGSAHNNLQPYMALHYIIKY